VPVRTGNPEVARERGGKSRPQEPLPAPPPEYRPVDALK
jgi:hypothetical protein